jgi:hypothetical protein
MACHPCVRYPCYGSNQRLVVCKDGEGPALKNKTEMPYALHMLVQFPVKGSPLGLGGLQLVREETKRLLEDYPLGS